MCYKQVVGAVGDAVLDREGLEVAVHVLYENKEFEVMVGMGDFIVTNISCYTKNSTIGKYCPGTCQLSAQIHAQKWQ